MSTSTNAPRQADQGALGRAASGAAQPIQVRLQEGDLAALDAFIETTNGATRPAAIRAILADWLAVHGFAKRTGHDHPQPSGPATEAIAAMEAAIREHKRKAIPRRSS